MGSLTYCKGFLFNLVRHKAKLLLYIYADALILIEALAVARTKFAHP